MIMETNQKQELYLALAKLHCYFHELTHDVYPQDVISYLWEKAVLTQLQKQEIEAHRTNIRKMQELVCLIQAKCHTDPSVYNHFFDALTRSGNAVLADKIKQDNSENIHQTAEKLKAMDVEIRQMGIRKTEQAIRDSIAETHVSLQRS